MTTRTKEQRADAALTGHDGFSLISNEKLIQLYATMLQCRMVKERLNKRPGSHATVLSHEAAVVGVAIDLLPLDNRVPACLDFSESLSLEKIFKSLLDRTHQPDPESQLTLATTRALADKSEKNRKITVVFSDDGSLSPGNWHQALKDAGVNQLPILFVSSTNPSAEPDQTEDKDIAHPAGAYGFPCIPVDGNDVAAVYRVATESIAQARKGNGPTLIECITGCSVDRDPIRNMETYLARKGLFREELKRELITSFNRKLDAVIGTAACE